MRKNVVMVAFTVIALTMMSIMVTVAYAPRADAIVIQNTYVFSIGPGGSWSTYSVLNDDVFGSTTGTGYADKYVMTVTARTLVTLELVDCCLMGDTIALGKSAKKYWSATSPDTVVLSGWLNPGRYVFFVGYIPPHTGVFPAGYDIYISG